MTLNFSGSWESVNDFLIALENLPHHIDIKMVAINSQKNEEGNIGWSASIFLTGVAK